MGTRMAPSYANLFMDQLERSFLAHPSTLKPFVWWRYIDDIFAIWTHGKETLQTFIKDLNTFHCTIKFTAEWSRDSVSFLDTIVRLNNGFLSTDLYQKPTDTHQYLSAKSCHPRHCKGAIPYSQALRIRRICSSNDDFLKHTDQLRSHLIRRGYDSSFVKHQIHSASCVTRKDTLVHPYQRSNNTFTRVPLVVTYHPNLPNFSAITGKFLPLLQISPRLKRIFPEKPIIAYRRPKNLRDLLVRAQLKPQEFLPILGSSPCESRRCLTCQHIRTGITIHSNCTGKTFNVWATATCKTANVIYLIECKLCHMQYVGETQNPLHIRVNGHRNDIRHKRCDKPVAAHFCSTDHSLSHLTILVLEQMRSENELLRKRRESYWIHQLQSLHPTGLNLDP